MMDLAMGEGSATDGSSWACRNLPRGDLGLIATRTKRMRLAGYWTDEQAWNGRGSLGASESGQELASSLRIIVLGHEGGGTGVDGEGWRLHQGPVLERMRPWQARPSAPDHMIGGQTRLQFLLPHVA